MENSELKPCPFCKCDAGDMCVGVVKEQGHYAVVCNSVLGGCGATAGFRETPELAIESWNTRAERTCEYLPDSLQVAFDENDEEIETGEADSDGCDYSCSSCGFTMLGGEIGWFDETEGEYGGWKYAPRFNYCPNCGAKVVHE